MNNEIVLEKAYAEGKRILNAVQVDEPLLRKHGWTGLLPTVVFTKFPKYWIKFDRSVGAFKVIKVEEALLKHEPSDPNAPLPITGKNRINLRAMINSGVKNPDEYVKAKKD